MNAEMYRRGLCDYPGDSFCRGTIVVNRQRNSKLCSGAGRRWGKPGDPYFINNTRKLPCPGAADSTTIPVGSYIKEGGRCVMNDLRKLRNICQNTVDVRRYRCGRTGVFIANGDIIKIVRPWGRYSL